MRAIAILRCSEWISLTKTCKIYIQMANKRVSMPFTDEAEEGACTSFYRVQWKLPSSEVWHDLIPNPVASPIIIENLLPETSYDVSVVRVCCNGQEIGRA